MKIPTLRYHALFLSNKGTGPSVYVRPEMIAGAIDLSIVSLPLVWPPATAATLNYLCLTKGLHDTLATAYRVLLPRYLYTHIIRE